MSPQGKHSPDSRFLSRITLYQGDVLSCLSPLPDNSIHCVVTSPPYWGLRDYGLQPLIWGGDSTCKHEWEENPARRNGRAWDPSRKDHEYPGGRNEKGTTGQTCRLCEAWLGSFGLEPVLDCHGWATGNFCGQCYICHSLQIYREVRRVLRPDGTFWLNVADCYNGSGGAGGDYAQGGRREGQPRYPGRNAPGLKRKDLCGVPQRLVLALQADGWWWRSDITWFKPNGMTESATDRPTGAHEYVYLFSKSAHYFYDQEAVKEPLKTDPATWGRNSKKDPGLQAVDPRPMFGPGRDGRDSTDWGDGIGRNIRSVWTIPTSPLSCGLCKVCGKYWHSKAPKEHCGEPVVGHFAAFPPKLVENCLAAGTSKKGCCPTCGAPWIRVVEKRVTDRDVETNSTYKKGSSAQKLALLRQASRKRGSEYKNETKTLGWAPTCKCPDHEPVPCIALDPFSGSGTTALVAAKMGRNAIGDELNPDYVEMSSRRLSRELGMWTEIKVINLHKASEVNHGLVCLVSPAGKLQKIALAESSEVPHV